MKNKNLKTRTILAFVLLLSASSSIKSQEIVPGWYGTIGVSAQVHSFHNYAHTFRSDELIASSGFPSSRVALMGNIGMWKQVYNSWGIRIKMGFSFLYGNDTRKTLSAQMGVSYDLTNLTERESPTRFMILGGMNYIHISKDVDNTRGNGVGPYVGVNLLVKKYGLYAQYSPMINRHGDMLGAYIVGFSYYVGVPSKGHKAVF